MTGFLPGNDSRTLWRLVRSIDGPSAGLDDYSRDFTYWALYRFREPLTPESFERIAEHFDDWSMWDNVGGYDNRTRDEAINEALRLSPARTIKSRQATSR